MEQEVRKASQTYDLGPINPIRLQVTITKTDALYLNKILRIEGERGKIYDGVGIPPFDAHVEDNDTTSRLPPIFSDQPHIRKESLKRAMPHLWRKGLLVVGGWMVTKNGHFIPLYRVPGYVRYPVLMGDDHATLLLTRREVAILNIILERQESPSATPTTVAKAKKVEGRLVEKEFPVVLASEISSETGIPQKQVEAIINSLGSRGFVIPVKQFSTQSREGLKSTEVFRSLFPFPKDKDPSPIFPSPEAGFDFLPRDIEKEIGAWIKDQVREKELGVVPREYKTPLKILPYKELLWVLELAEDDPRAIDPIAELQLETIKALRKFRTPERTVRALGTEFAASEPRKMGASLTKLRLERLKDIFRSQEQGEAAAE